MEGSERVHSNLSHFNWSFFHQLSYIISPPVLGLSISYTEDAVGMEHTALLFCPKEQEVLVLPRSKMDEACKGTWGKGRKKENTLPLNLKSDSHSTLWPVMTHNFGYIKFLLLDVEDSFSNTNLHLAWFKVLSLRHIIYLPNALYIRSTFSLCPITHQCINQ